jgi:thiol-disulfide isomerase/thioredoxin
MDESCFSVQFMVSSMDESCFSVHFMVSSMDESCFRVRFMVSEMSETCFSIGIMLSEMSKTCFPVGKMVSPVGGRCFPFWTSPVQRTWTYARPPPARPAAVVFGRENKKNYLCTTIIYICLKYTSMKKVFFIAAVVLWAASCAPHTPQSFLIEGTISDSAYNGQWVYMKDYEQQSKVIDSALVVDGKFVFSGQADTTLLIRLEPDMKLFANIIREAGTIEVDLSDYKKIGGTPLNDTYKTYLLEQDERYRQVSEKYRQIEEDYRDDAEAHARQLEEHQKLTSLSYNAFNARYFFANKNNAIGSAVFNGWTYELSPEKVDSLYAELGDGIKHYSRIRRIMDMNEKKKQTATGKMFTDFTIEHGNPDSTAASFSDYIGKGKYVLVDFWASWCGPCIAENPVIAEVYNKYKGDKFDVLGVAVWDEREATLNAIRKHNITWPQIIDAEMIPFEIYGLQGIPYLILFGPDGTILARNLRGGAIKVKVAEIMK